MCCIAAAQPPPENDANARPIAPNPPRLDEVDAGVDVVGPDLLELLDPEPEKNCHAEP
jgi:hypothetical protein